MRFGDGEQTIQSGTELSPYRLIPKLEKTYVFKMLLCFVF